jgi:hypothetical protein
MTGIVKYVIPTAVKNNDFISHSALLGENR